MRWNIKPGTEVVVDAEWIDHFQQLLHDEFCKRINGHLNVPSYYTLHDVTIVKTKCDEVEAFLDAKFKSSNERSAMRLR